MNSIRNLSDAGKMLPSWALPLALSAVMIGALAFAHTSLTNQPHPLIAQGTLFAVVGAFAVAALQLIAAITSAKTGTLRASMSSATLRGLNFIWSTTSVALVVFVGAEPALAAITENLATSLMLCVTLAVMGVAYFVSKPKQAEATVDPISGLPATTALALPKAFEPTKAQLPAFQVTMADLTRLMIHQAGRLIAYKGSNCILADSFSANLDVNARTAQIFSEMNLVATPRFIYWRMHMLMMGSAAEHVIRNSMSEAALDDMQSFDDLASRYMALSFDNQTYSRPTNETEAAIRSARIAMLRKQVWSRCVTACTANKKVLLDLIRVMRGQACLAYGDIKHLMDRLEMPNDFPVAEFDTDSLMEQTLLAIEHQDEAPVHAATDAEDKCHAHSQSRSTQAPKQDTLNVYQFNA